MPCIVCMIALYLLFLPPFYSPVDPAATAHYTAAALDYVVDDSTPTVELPGKQSHFPSPSYRLSCLYLSVALGICCYYATFLFNCIACLCRPCYTFFYPIQPVIYIIYSSEPCALLA